MTPHPDIVTEAIREAPSAFYYGCWDRPGHYLHDVDGRRVWGSRWPKSIPWTEGHMDTGLLTNGRVPDSPDGRVYWTCGGRPDLWFAFYWWDRSVDTRGACNSGFYVRGFSIDDVEGAFSFACSSFPTVVARQRFPLRLQGIRTEAAKVAK